MRVSDEYPLIVMAIVFFVSLRLRFGAVSTLFSPRNGVIMWQPASHAPFCQVLQPACCLLLPNLY